MDNGEVDVTLPVEFNLSPLRALNVATRRKLSNFLDLEGNLVVIDNDGVEQDVVNDYNGLAELAGFNYQEIMNMRRQKSPTTELLDLWTPRNGTVGKMWTFLHMMERYDVLAECRRPVVHDCKRYMEYEQLQMDAEQCGIDQDPTVSTSEMEVDETKFATVQDVRSPHEQKFYDAFICYSPEDELDRKFLFMLIDELEKERGLKLFVPGRDDLPGSAQHTITAYLIEKRCKRVVILMSRMFLCSAACDFQVKFAHALAPGARSKKLIPVIREKNTPIPRILRFLAVCDFTKSDMVEWVWDRLEAAIRAPVGPITYFDNDDCSNELDEIAFPAPRRLDEHEHVPSSEPEAQPRGGNHSQIPSDERQPVEISTNTLTWGQPASSDAASSTEEPSMSDDLNCKPKGGYSSPFRNFFSNKSSKGKDKTHTMKKGKNKK